MTTSDTAASKTRTVPVFINRRKVDLPMGPIGLATLLEQAAFEGTSWDILLLQGEGDPTGGIVLQSDAPVDIKAGMHFRVIPGDRTFGMGSAPCRRKVPPTDSQGRA